MMNHVFNLKNSAVSAKASVYRPQIKRNALAFVLLVFVAVAAMQAVQLSNMLSEAKVVSEDVRGIRAEQTLLHEKYAAYGNNLSYYFEDSRN